MVSIFSGFVKYFLYLGLCRIKLAVIGKNIAKCIEQFLDILPIMWYTIIINLSEAKHELSFRKRDCEKMEYIRAKRPQLLCRGTC